VRFSPYLAWGDLDLLGAQYTRVHRWRRSVRRGETAKVAAKNELTFIRVLLPDLAGLEVQQPAVAAE
jgi:hypothetical protein